MTFTLATTLRESTRSAPDKTLTRFADQSVSYAFPSIMQAVSVVYRFVT
jgi:hypothetical protein